MRAAEFHKGQIAKAVNRAARADEHGRYGGPRAFVRAALKSCHHASRRKDSATGADVITEKAAIADDGSGATMALDGEAHLNKDGYPPELLEEATKNVLMQAELVGTRDGRSRHLAEPCVTSPLAPEAYARKRLYHLESIT